MYPKILRIECADKTCFHRLGHHITKYIYYYHHLCICTAVVVKPQITTPLKDITIEEQKTAIFECHVTATSMADWTMFRWLKNGGDLPENTGKYLAYKEQNPTSFDGNSMIGFLKIFKVSKGDEANYTCIVYYNDYVLEKLKIKKEFSDQTTASLFVNTSNPTTSPSPSPSPKGVYVLYTCVYM